MKIDKLILFAVGLFIYFSAFLAAFTNINQINQIDTIIFALLVFQALFIFLFTGKINLPGAIFFVANLSFFTISLFGSYTSSITISFLSTLLFTKIFLVFFSLYNYKIEYFSKFIFFLFITHFIGIFLNILFPNFFIQLFPDTAYELDSSRIGGFLINPNLSASVSMTLALYYYFIRNSFLPFLFSLLFLFLTGSISFFIIFFILFIYFSAITSKISVKMNFLLIIFAVTFYFLFSQAISDRFFAIENTLDSGSQYIRVGMLIGGFSLANKYFPFGAGGGTFGSSLASNTSNTYSEVGLSNWTSIVESTGKFDSGIGSILGEYGYLGFLLFLSLLYYMFKSFSNNSIKKIDCYAFVLLVIFLSFFRSVATDFFYSLIIFLNFLILINLRSKFSIHESNYST